MSEPRFPVPKPPLLSKTGSQGGEQRTGYFNYEVEPGLTIQLRHNFDPAMDPKKLKRLISNRISAQKSRGKKVQHVNDLVKKSSELNMEVSMLRSLVGKASEQKQRLEMEQKELKNCVSGWLQHLISIQGEIEINRLEIERLKKKMDPFWDLTNMISSSHYTT